jgi:glycosyltransferase involved in cell wall biosynthesis
MIIYIVIGSLEQSLITSKVIPISQLEQVDKLVIFCENQDIAIPKSECIRLHLPFKRSRHPLNSIWRIVGTFIHLMGKFFSCPPDLVFGVYTLPYGLISFIFARLIQKPVAVGVIGGVVEIQTYYPLKFLWKWINLFYLRRSNAILTTGNRVKKYLIENGLDPGRIFILSGAVDIDALYPLATTLRDIDLLFIGSFTPRKGPDRFIEIFYKLKSKFPELRAVLLGDGPLRAVIFDRVNQLGISSDVEIPGYVNNVPSYARRAKLFILPSKSEGLSKAMLQAMAAGVVPIVPNVDDLTDVAKHGLNALVVEEYDDIDRYVFYASRLLIDQDEWKRLSSEAIITIKQNWSFSEESVRWQSMLEQTIPQKHKIARS